MMVDYICSMTVRKILSTDANNSRMVDDMTKNFFSFSGVSSTPVGVWALRRAHEEFLASFRSKFAKINAGVYSLVLF